MDGNTLEKSSTRDTKPQSDRNSDSDLASTCSYLEDVDGGDQPSRNGISRIVSEVRDGIESRRDLDIEKGNAELGEEEGEESEKAPATNPNPMSWDGPDDPENPKNWPITKKYGAVLIVSLFTLASPVASSMVAPSLTVIGEELNIPDAFEQSLVLSIFVLAYAIGPLIWGPFCEIWGRVLVLQLSNLGYLAFNIGCGFAQTKGQMISFRFLAGLGGSASLAIGGGVMSDLFVPEERGRAISMYSLAPLLGPAIGPIAGAFITENTTWRWVFYATSIFDAAVQIAGLFFLKETYAPLLLARRQRARLSEDKDSKEMEKGGGSAELWPKLQAALTRPFRLLATQVIVQCLALYMMFVYGIIYLQLASFPTLFTTPAPDGYGMSVGIGGLNYISLGIGFFLGAQICAHLQDRFYAALKRRYGGVGKPEFRVPMMIPGALLVPIGLFIYGWTAEYKTHWIGPNIGALVFAAGSICSFQCLQTFLVDAYPRYAASAVGAATVLRSLAGFGFPLFAPSLYDRLGYGYGNTLMALLALAIGLPSPILLWKYGEILRKRSPFAAGA
ncbi:MFS general substrate transporter [Hypoxylon sp. FL1284]|nr:MFS general substrate transporter [Hypoxylon sp. FL1284]